MLITNSNDIEIDLLEIIADFDLPFNKYKPVKPLKTGGIIHNFNLVKENLNKQQIFKAGGANNSDLFRQLAGKPVVISFYSALWNDYGQYYLRQLNSLQREIKRLGANLLVVTPDEADKTLDEIIWNNSLSLNFYFDQENAIAGLFKVYSDADPVWNKYPGIDVNVPLLSTFIIDDTYQIIFDHVNYSLEDKVSPKGIFEAITNIVNGVNKKSA